MNLSYFFLNDFKSIEGEIIAMLSILFPNSFPSSIEVEVVTSEYYLI